MTRIAYSSAYMQSLRPGIVKLPISSLSICQYVSTLYTTPLYLAGRSNGFDEYMGESTTKGDH